MLRAGSPRHLKDDTTIVDGGGSKTEPVAERTRAAGPDIEKHRFGLGPGEAAGTAGQIGRPGVAGHRKVGAATETEVKERKHRIEDAVAATKAAVAEGIIARRRFALWVRTPRKAKLAGSGGRAPPGTSRPAWPDRPPGTGRRLRAFWIAANARGGEEGAVVVNKIAGPADRARL